MSIQIHNQEGENIPSFQKRFWASVNKNGKEIPYAIGSCWEWTKSKDKDGYSRIRLSGKNFFVHRASWCIANDIELSALSREIIVLHKCDNRSCVNPNHLYIGDHKQNALDRCTRGRTHIPAYGNPGFISKLTPDKVIEIRRLLSIGINGSQVAEKFKVSNTTISKIRTGKKWKWLLPI